MTARDLCLLAGPGSHLSLHTCHHAVLRGLPHHLGRHLIFHIENAEERRYDSAGELGGQLAAVGENEGLSGPLTGSRRSKDALTAAMAWQLLDHVGPATAREAGPRWSFLLQVQPRRRSNLIRLAHLWLIPAT